MKLPNQVDWSNNMHTYTHTFYSQLIYKINITVQLHTHSVLIDSLSSLVRKLPSAEGPSPTEVAANTE